MSAPVVLEHERVNRIQFAAITPYPMTHRFYGRSVADLLIEIQRIKTALTRMLLDSGYFALNQRVQVDMNKATEFTIDDLLRQEPGIPVRVRGGSDAVAPLQSGELGFDVAGALELISVAAENRSGILRNSQGLNPDTLHDTATGAMAMLSNAQKRVRMIARIFAETGFKDLWLGVHAMLRTHAERPLVVRLTGGWVAVDPTSWSERDDMTIHLGVGSGGQAQAAQTGQALLALMQQVGSEQGAMGVQIVSPQNVYNAIEQFVTRGLGFKGRAALHHRPGAAAGADARPAADAGRKRRPIRRRRRSRLCRRSCRSNSSARRRTSSMRPRNCRTIRRWGWRRSSRTPRRRGTRRTWTRRSRARSWRRRCRCGGRVAEAKLLTRER